MWWGSLSRNKPLPAGCLHSHLDLILATPPSFATRSHISRRHSHARMQSFTVRAKPGYLQESPATPKLGAICHLMARTGLGLANTAQPRTTR